MSDFSALDFDLGEDDLARMLRGQEDAPGGAATAAQSAEAVDASEELQALSRRIAGQYVDVVAAFAVQIFAGKRTAAASTQVRSAVGSLRRLAVAAADQDLTAILDRFAALVEGDVWKGRRRQTRIRQLRELLLEFAEALGEDAGSRLREIVVFDRRSVPLLDELAALHGIGPRRLERLYCAGLFTVEVVGAADPEEIAQVTGMPRRLAHKVVEATRRYAAEERRRCVIELRQRSAELRETIGALNRGRGPDPDLLAMARAALEDLQLALQYADEKEVDS